VAASASDFPAAVAICIWTARSSSKYSGKATVVNIMDEAMIITPPITDMRIPAPTWATYAFSPAVFLRPQTSTPICMRITA